MVRLHPHTRERMDERGATEEEVSARVEQGKHFLAKHGDIDSVRISDELVVDTAPDGTLYGNELLNPNERSRRDETEKLLIINEATGEQVEFPLATS